MYRYHKYKNNYKRALCLKGMVKDINMGWQSSQSQTSLGCRATQGIHLGNKVKVNEDNIKQHDQGGDNDGDR